MPSAKKALTCVSRTRVQAHSKPRLAKVQLRFSTTDPSHRHMDRH